MHSAVGHIACDLQRPLSFGGLRGVREGHAFKSMHAVRIRVVMPASERHALGAGRLGGVPSLTKGIGVGSRFRV